MRIAILKLSVRYFYDKLCHFYQLDLQSVLRILHLIMAFESVDSVFKWVRVRVRVSYYY